jgi:hypothetical protein
MKYSFVGMGACGLVACWVTYLEMNHEHHHAPDRPYKNVSETTTYHSLIDPFFVSRVR